MVASVTLLMMPGMAQAQTVTAMWDPSPPQDAVTSYQVCLGTASLTCNIQLATVPATGNSYTFTPSAGVLHYVAIRAVNAVGNGPYSPEVTFSTPNFAQPANRSNPAGTAITPINFSVTDPDGSALTFTHTGLPVGLSLNASTGQVTGTPATAGTYPVTIFVTDGLASVSRTFTWTVTGGSTSPLTLTALTSNLSSPRSVNTAITFTATATGGTAPYQFKFLLSTNGGASFTMVRDWSTSASYVWTPTAANTYQIRVWARNAGSVLDENDVNRTVSFVITGGTPAPLSLTGLTSNLASPRPVNTAITFTATASGGTAPYQFKYWVSNNSGSSWTMVRDWNTSASYVWTPTVAGTGYQIRVWARNAGSTADVGTVNRIVPYVITATTSPLTLTNLTSNVASPRTVNTAITFTATASGGTTPYQFKYWVSSNSGSTWTMVRDWNTSASYVWTPTVANANYRIRVWARNAGSTADVGDVNRIVPYVITTASTGPLTVTGLTGNPASPRRVNTSVTFTATASGGTAPYQYKFLVHNGTAWTVMRDWSTSATFNWTPTRTGTHIIRVWVRNAGSTADSNDVNRSVNYQITQ